MKELGLSPIFFTCKTLNYSEKDKPLVYANEYFNTEIIKFNLIRTKEYTILRKGTSSWLDEVPSSFL